MSKWSIAALFSLALLSSSASAVQTSHWLLTSEADFKNGTFQNVVATNLGDLKLSRATKTLQEQNDKVSAVYAMVEAPDGTVYAGTGPQGVLLKITGDKVEDALKLEDGTSIFSLAIDGDGGVLIGTGGEKGQILKLDKAGGKPKEIFSGEGVQYVWSIVRTSDGMIYAATGPEGQLFEIKPDGSGHSMILDTDENNLLCMISDGKDLLYIGTDPNGLVYRFNRKTKEAYIMHDAPESEISALALDKAGNLYAATAEAMAQAGESEPAGATEQIGRPEESTTGAPIPGPAHPEPGKPPELPNPNPGEPDPIPKKLMILVTRPSTHGSGSSNSATTAKNKAKAEDDGDQAMPNPTTGPSGPAHMAPPPAPRPSGEAGQPREGGNAIYKIDKDGLVTEIFRQPVLVMSMIAQPDGALLVGTGSDGLIYQINPTAEETVVLAKVEPKQVMSLLPSGNRILLGLANTGGIAAMTSGFANDGTYTSPVLDAQQVSRFGKMQLHGSLPQGTALKVQTRSGNVEDPGDIGWSKWTDAQAATQFMNVAAPSARFLQYRLSFTSEDGKRTAVVDDTDIAYQQPNLAPMVKSIKATTKPSGGGGEANQSAGGNGNGHSSIPPESRFQTISWEASDPNSDDLEYSVYFRNGTHAPWILLKDKLHDTNYDWDTRSVSDGRYELRVVASDERANAPGEGKTASRISDPLEVNNTPPIIRNLKASGGAGQVRIQCDAASASSTLAAFGYVCDSSDDWQTVLPVDKIADGPEEKLDFSIADLKSGPHQVTVRAIDDRGNQATATVSVTIDAPATKP